MSEIRIKPIKGFINIDWRELWRYRELFYFLSWRDIKVRYKQTAFGILWAILQPLLTMVIFTIFFGKVAGISSSDIPYPIFVYTGLLFWNYFSNSLGSSGNALISNQAIIQKIYFPLKERDKPFLVECRAPLNMVCYREGLCPRLHQCFRRD